MNSTASNKPRPGGVRRTALGATLGLLMAGASLTPGQPALATPAADAAAVRVIVRAATTAGVPAAERLVDRLGGTTGRHLPSISGFVAELPSSAVPALRAADGVAGVTEDAAVRLKSDTWIDEPGANEVEEIGTTAGTESTAGAVDTRTLTGAGVGVALIDSGVAPVQGLSTPGKVINGPDLSFESQAANLTNLDTYGHGTHLAGIIAGSDPAGTPAAGRFDGIAPGAHVVSLKVAAADGASDVSQVIAAIDWVTQHRNDPGLNIRVLNLSFGTDSVQDAVLDPLSYAVEAAWRAGIVAVVAVGNDGAEATRVTMPAANPYVIAVGATDTAGTADPADDTVADFSSRGSTTRHADVLAGGRSVVSLRAPGSYADVNHPGARITDGNGDERLFRGSGTSQSTAVVSGSVALLLQQRPNLTPDQVKALLMGTADPVGTDPVAAGAGQIDIAAAANTAVPANATQTFPAASGMGTLEGSRGTTHVADPEDGTVLAGEQDIFGAPWNPSTWTAAVTVGNSWTGGDWNGNSWAGTDWTGSSWTARTWSARTWSARTWSARTWSARTWSSAEWTASGWSARTWSARTWSARTWSARTWSTMSGSGE